MKLFQDQKAYVAYLTAGDGGLEYCLESALALIEGGVNLLEIGVPFSDPVVDGPVIQRAMERSLRGGTTPYSVLKLISRIRQYSQVPLVLFSYCNPLFQCGSGYLQAAKEAGANGLLVVDLPIEEDIIQSDLDRVQLIATSTPIQRLPVITAKAQGFLYYVCQKGTTGTRSVLPDDFKSKLECIKQQVTLPVVAGFGISSAEQVREVLKYADGVVVGSFFVDAMSRRVQPEQLAKLAASLTCM